MGLLTSLIKELFLARSSLRESTDYPSEVDQSLRIASTCQQEGQPDEAASIYRAILQTHPNNPDANHELGKLFFQAQEPQAALPFLQAAQIFNPGNSQYWMSLIECLAQLQAWSDAAKLLIDAEADGLKLPLASQLIAQIRNRRDQIDHIAAAKSRFPGPDYLEWLKWLHLTLQPANYVEIGVETGKSLQFAQRSTRTVGIDPAINIVFSQESWTKLFKLTSDDFFSQHDLLQVLDAEHVDMAFIDGLHTFDQALKDFVNIERHSRPETVVVFHDIFPVTPITAARERETIFWLGDTWKVVLILRELRPDLNIFTVPTFPSGLTIVTGLNAKDTLLSDEYVPIIDRWRELEVDSFVPEMDVHLNVTRNDFATVAQLLGH